MVAGSVISPKELPQTAGCCGYLIELVLCRLVHRSLQWRYSDNTTYKRIITNVLNCVASEKFLKLNFYIPIIY
jgi:hypothetical protein